MPCKVILADSRIVIHKFLALADQTLLLETKSEGYDICPMESYDSGKVKKILKLLLKAEINMVISVGTGFENGPRFCVSCEEIWCLEKFYLARRFPAAQPPHNNSLSSVSIVISSEARNLPVFSGH
ncbi:MAG: nitroreductase family protein [Bacteroidales bacterium]|nr:nitroreductase family protein [Bacteroidales bacterium]